jgi:uncharacterized membrane protein YvbJ
MALVVCNECGEQISEFATSCPKCGFPRRTGEQEVSGIKAGAPIEIELTNKRLKLQSLIASLLVIIGFCIMIMTAMLGDAYPHEKRTFGFLSSLGFVAIVVGLVWLIVTRVRRWWRHG